MRIGFAGVVVGTLAVMFAQSASANSVAAQTQRADALVQKMTLPEELSLVGSGVDGVPRLGIPPLAFTDGPNGVGEGAKGVTSFPNAVNIGASWDPALARAYGAALGAETAGKGKNLMAAPTINIVRSPKWGRSAETLGEDPFLTSSFDVPEIQGIQSKGVMAQVKHYAVNNQEVGRFGPGLGAPAVDVQVADRTLHEIYYPGFKAAVTKGQAASVMCSYVRINGSQSCENPTTLGELRRFGFTGFVEPDATLAVRNVIAAANAGVDNFQLGSIASAAAGAAGGQGRAETKALTTAVGNGSVSRAVIDRGARNILIAMDRVGLLKNGNPKAKADVSTSAHRKLATKISAQSTVLMKNQNQVLPLTKKTKKLAVIGYDAGSGTQTEENGSPAVLPGRKVITPLAGIRSRAPHGTSVKYVAGTRGIVPLPAVPSSVLKPSSGSGNGLSGSYYSGTAFAGSPILQRNDPTIGFKSDSRSPLVPIPGTDAGSVRWTGTITPPKSGVYRFSLAAAGISKLTIDGKVVAAGNTEFVTGDPTFPGAPPISAQGMVSLKGGTPVSISVEYSTGLSISGAEFHLGWQTPDTGPIKAAVAVAKKAKVAVVFANDRTSEGADRTTLALEGDQNQLIEAVAKANPKTIVVLHTSGPVLMPWRRKVAGIVEAWYPGQMSGRAIAQTLYGGVDPSGHLPVTWPASSSQGPTATPGEYPGTDNVVKYSEALQVGYRYYDSKGQKPAYPFGYGLSYTKFHLGKPALRKGGSGSFNVLVPVKNTGRRTGAQVVQAYVKFPSSAGEPPRQLKAFARVELGAGRKKMAKLHLGPDAFQIWSTTANSWKKVPGRYTVFVGTSSRELPYRLRLRIPGA